MATGMRLVLAAALLVGQPEAPASTVQGVVWQPDGSPAAGSRVELRCGDWVQMQIADEAGAFTWADVPVEPCTLVARWPDDAGAGVTLDVPVERRGHVVAMLPSALTTPRAPSAPSAGFGLHLTTGVDSRASKLPAATVSGVSSWSSSLDPLSPGKRPDGWTTGLTFTSSGPFGTTLSGTASARRVSGATTLLTDVTGAPPPDSGMWSALVDPSRTLVWDVRFGVEKQWKVGSANITIFSDAYRSFQGGSTRDAAALPSSATKNLRTGAAGRVGVKVGF